MYHNIPSGLYNTYYYITTETNMNVVFLTLEVVQIMQATRIPKANFCHVYQHKQFDLYTAVLLTFHILG